MFAEACGQIEDSLAVEDVQKVERLVPRMLFPAMLDANTHPVLREWLVFKNLLLHVVPKLLARDLAEEKASSLLVELRQIWRDLAAATSSDSGYFDYSE